MKNFILLFILSVLTIVAKAQSPQAINYQAVARDNSGNPLTNKNIGVRVGILSGSSTGTSVYSETHSVTTNQFGLFNIEIGRGVVQSGIFAQINWGSNTHFAKIDIDQNGGTNYQFVGTSQMLSVPYALFSENVAMLYKLNPIFSNYSGDTTTIYQSDIRNPYKIGDVGLLGLISYYAGTTENLTLNVSGFNSNVFVNGITFPYSVTAKQIERQTPDLYGEIHADSANASGFYTLKVTSTNPRGIQNSSTSYLNIISCNVNSENDFIGTYYGTGNILFTGAYRDTMIITNPINSDGLITLNLKLPNLILNANRNGNKYTASFSNVSQTINSSLGVITITNASGNINGELCGNRIVQKITFTSGTYNGSGNLSNFPITETFYK